MRMLRKSPFWAKLDEADPARWHPLIAHSADVAAVTARLLEGDSPIGDRLQSLSGTATSLGAVRELLILIAAMHDLGKTNHGFQERRLPRASRRFGHEGHVQVVLQSLENRMFAETVQKAFEGVVQGNLDLLPLFAAGIAHHGTPFEPRADRGGLDRLWVADPHSGRDPLEEIRRLGRHARFWSGADASASIVHLPADPRFTHLFAGLVTLSDWIGSTQSIFEFTPSADEDPDRYWEEVAVPRADRACREIGLVAWRAVVSMSGTSLYERVFPRIFGGGSLNRPTELQMAAATVPMPPAGSRILIEAATGSGKTEAALALYARLRAQGRVGGLMFALPTRATASAMRDRVAAALAGIYGKETPGVTLAVGGEVPVAVRADPVSMSEGRLYDEEEGAGALYAWASTHSKRFLAAEIVVGTVDQALLAALAVRHAHLRLAGLSRHLLVVDEVHSHDRYMLRILRTLLDVHSDAGGHALLMSATLSTAARRQLGGSSHDDGSFDEAVHRPYPVLSTLARGGEWDDLSVDVGQVSRTVAWELSVQDAGIQEAIRAARAGARVCLLRNLVKDAQLTVKWIQDTGDGNLLWRPPGAVHAPPYHAKYAGPDRALLDDAVLARFGKDGPREGGCILVATQVVEQSLDVDFDLLVTDLAPVEVLVQRIGRLHRHSGRTARGDRPLSCQDPRAVILGPEEPFRPAREYRGPHGWGQPVYRELPVLELTRRLIERRPTIEIPAANRVLMEEVYHSSRLAQLRQEPGWEPVLAEMDGIGLGETLHASQCVLRFDEAYHQNASRYQNVRIRTRLGDDTIRVKLDPPVPCWYVEGAKESHVPLRLDQVLAAGIDPEAPGIGPGREGAGDVMAYPLGRKVLIYEPSGWRVSTDPP